jgi:pyruvate formate lyase activating enzyme
MNTAVVFNVQRFSLHDGPGIRTTVFLKGCPLNCPWCHNPESRDGQPQLAIKADRCVGCEQCTPVCPENLAGPVQPGTDVNRPGVTCLRCGACAEACPSGARELLGEDMEVDGLLAEIERDRSYHQESGGGVTFSGGEPVAVGNAPFLLECLTEIGKRGVHRTVDTCGHVATDTLLAVAAQAELILYDLKIMDNARHRLVMGVGNERILQNLRALTERGHEVWIRVPLIPGLTDDEDNLTAVAEFVSSLPKRCPIHLLPYHATGGNKYGRLDLDYPLAALVPADPRQMERQADFIRAQGLEVHIGG